MSTQPPLKLRQGDVLGKKYEIDADLGQGPQGASYSARALATGKKVVVKLLSGPCAPDAQADATLKRLRDVNSDALVKVLDSGEHAGRRWVAMELAEGESLRRLMDNYAGQKKPFTLQEASQIVVKICEAIEAAHEKGLIHRHLKPSNVIVQSRQVGPGKTIRTVKITGFGLSDLVHSGVLQEGLAERPADARYMAPELSSPSHGGTAQSDLYSAGVVFYELLCGQTPMGTYLSPSQIREDLPHHADNIVDIAIAANAEDRYPTARDMLNDVQRAFQDEDAPVAGLSRRTLAIIIGAVVAVAAVAVAVLAVSDPQAAAKADDARLRAAVAKANPTLDEATVRQKLVGHEEMIYIPAGTFVLGAMKAEKVAGPKEPTAAEVKTDAYYIDRFEWPNRKDANPITNVSWEQAQKSCEGVGKRLCTSLEWERACKGPANSIYSYGNTYDPAACGPDVAPDANRDDALDRASGSGDACRSGYGVFDVSGGAREWTATGGKDQTKFKVIKGGRSGTPEQASRCSYSDERSPGSPDRTLGFRCCLSEADATKATGAGGATPAGGAAPADGAPPEGAATPPPAN